MVSSSQNHPASGGFSMFRDPAGGDPSSPFLDDPSLGESTEDAPSGNVGAAEDLDDEEEDVDEDDLDNVDSDDEEDIDEDEDDIDEDEDDEFDDEEDEEAGV